MVPATIYQQFYFGCYFLSFRDDGVKSFWLCQSFETMLIFFKISPYKFSFIKVYLKFSASSVLFKILKQNLFRSVSLIFLNKKPRWYHRSRRFLPPKKKVVGIAFLTELGNLESFQTMLFFILFFLLQATLRGLSNSC